MFPTDCVPAVLAAVASVVGQMQPLPGVSPAVQTHLRAWERASAGVKTFTAEFTKVVEDRIISRQTTYTGSVWLKKPNLARLRVEHQPAPEQKRDPDAYEAYICDGNEAFVYVGGTRTVTVYPLAGLPAAANNPLFNFIVRMDPQNWPFVGPENLLTLAAGGRVNAAQLVRRFDIREVPDKKGGPYLYLEFVPGRQRIRLCSMSQPWRSSAPVSSAIGRWNTCRGSFGSSGGTAKKSRRGTSPAHRSIPH